MPNSIVHFEIPADDVPRALSFYKKVFGWKNKRFPMPEGNDYYGLTTKKPGEPGIDGGLMKRAVPGQAFANYVSVKSIDRMNERIQAAGGIVILPKQAIGPEMGWISMFKDTENNIIGLHEMAPAPRKKAPAKKTLRKPVKRAAAAKKRR